VRVPDEYMGREQSLLKHRVLEEYLVAWGHKLGSVAQRRRVRLCYVDGFAGPWNSQSKTLQDTSIAIGLRALEAAANTWGTRGANIDVEAAFVEKEEVPFRELERYLGEHQGVVRTYPLHGEFGEMVPKLQSWLRSDAALVFVDPTGWKGAAMGFIAPLVKDQPRRDVLVNVMFDHINRFKDDPRAFLREQMREFFGLGESELPEGLAEEDLFALYRAKLKETSVGCVTPQTSRFPTQRMIGRSFALSLQGRAPPCSRCSATWRRRWSAPRLLQFATTPRPGGSKREQGSSR
jgi:three-Cys-motif partner protein